MQKKVFFTLFYFIIASTATFSFTSCTSRIHTMASVKQSFDSYEKVAIFWDRERDEMRKNFFLSYWMETFPEQTVVERKELRKIIREQDLLPKRINEKTRARIRNILGVRALVIVTLHKQNRGRYISPRETTHLSIKVLDTETGEIAVSALSEGKDCSIQTMIIETIRFIKKKAANLTFQGPQMF
jgi:hypothetical protein